ncbi:glycosyl hydrolase family 25 [Cooperia oncophora]
MNFFCNNFKKLYTAGIKRVDGYIFPCQSSSCKGGAEQVAAASSALEKAGAKVDTLWLDVERHQWPKDHVKNRAFIEEMGNKLTEHGHKWGVYTNLNNWKEIVGLDYTGMKDKPLWWAYYDNQPNFNNFKPFGGWEKPAIHQYKGDVTGRCPVKSDLNWLPDE